MNNVQIGDEALNNAVTSKEAILKVSGAWVSRHGPTALNMRTVAQECGVALGTLYRYFPSKDALLLATVESVWREVFHTEGPQKKEASFPEAVEQIFLCVRRGMERYPHFFTTHSIAFAGESKGQARELMERYFLHMKSGLLAALARDPQVGPRAFDGDFTAEAAADLALSSLVALLVQRKTSCEPLLEVLRRTLYERPPAL